MIIEIVFAAALASGQFQLTNKAPLLTIDGKEAVRLRPDGTYVCLPLDARQREAILHSNIALQYFAACGKRVEE